jgi:hypothetical protein
LQLRNGIAASMVVALATLVLTPSPARGQGGTQGSILGYVYDQTGNPIKGVKVTATSPTQIGGGRSAYTSDEGAFRIRQLFPGTFEVRAQAPKLKTVIQKDIAVGITAPAEVNLIMEVEVQGVEEVKVVQKAPVVSTTTANIKEVYDLDFVENLPHGSRDNIHNQMVNSIAGGVNGRVRGGATNQTLFTQDGFEMRGQYPVLKSSAAYEIQSGGYGADNATASGGLINLVTKTGSNKFEFDFNATADMDELRFFKDERDARAGRFFYVINPTFSGPIVKDRLWFHFATESHIIKTGRNPDAEGIFAEPIEYRKFIQKGTLKLTWQVSPRNKLTSLNNFDFPYEMNMNDGVGVEQDAQRFRQGQRYMTGLIWESLLTDNLILRAQAGYIQIPQIWYPWRCRQEPGDCLHIPAEQQNFPRRSNYGNDFEAARRDDLYSVQAQSALEWFIDGKALGEHNLALKNRFYTEEDIRRSARPGDMLTEYRGPVPESRTFFFSNDPRYEQERYGWFIASHTLFRNLVTLADQWRPTRHLTLTPAISHVWATGSNSRGDQLVDATTWAPSVAGAWDATHDGRTVVRGSFSQYVDVDLENVARHTVGGQAQRKCLWDEATATFSRNCEFSGGLTRNTFGSPCGPSGIDVTGQPCTEKLTIPRTWEYAAGVEREVVTGVALAADVVYRQYTNQYETRETNRIWNAAGSELEKGFRNGRAETVIDLGTPAEARRRYVGLSAALSKREGRLKTHVSYTWSRLDGTVENGSSNRFLDIPGRDIYLQGPLSDDHRHEIKGTLQYALAGWASFGLRYTYLSGFPYNRLFRNVETGSFEDFRARTGINPGGNLNDPGDDRELRLPDRQEVNLQLRLSMLPLIGQRLDFYVDVLNALALRTPTQLGVEDGRDFGVERAWMEPFRVRLGMNLRF